MKQTDGESPVHIGFLSRTSMYGFELFMALFGLVTTLVVLDYGIFALCNYLRGMNEVGPFVGNFTIWIIAAIIVWLPVTLVFYLRSRAEAQYHPMRTSSTLHHTLLSIYYFAVIIGAIGLLFGALYFLVRMAVMPDDTSLDSFVRIVLPALLAVVIHIGMMFAFTKAKRPSSTWFAGGFGGLVTVVAVLLLIFSASVIRGAKQDDTTVMDLNNIQSTIATYYIAHQVLPTSLGELDFSKQDIASRLSKYTYTTQPDSERYELCADFATSNTSHFTTQTTTSVISSEPASDDYQPYTSFYSHGSGHVCFKLQVYSDKVANPATLNKF